MAFGVMVLSMARLSSHGQRHDEDNGDFTKHVDLHQKSYFLLVVG